MCWASLAPAPTLLLDLHRMAQVVHPRDGVASLTLRFAWVVPLGLAAFPVAWLLVDERLLAAATGASFSSCSPWCCADCCQSTSFSCCSSFHPTWCASLLLVIRFTCPRSTTGLPAGSACGIDLVARPYRWPILGVGLAAYPVAWLLGAAPVVAWFHLLWHASLALVLWFTCPRSATGLLASSVCGAVLAARPLRWQILGVEFDVCPTAWLLVFERFGSLARPPSWLFTWYASYLLWANFYSNCLCLSRLPTPFRIALQSPYLLPLWSRLAHYFPSLFRQRSATLPRGRLSVVDDDLDAPVPVDSAFEGPSVRPGSNGTNASAPDPVVPIVAASVARTPPAPAATSVADNPHDSSVPSETADLVDDVVDDASPVPDASELAAARSNPDEAPYDPMVHTETSDMLEEALGISRDCILLADLTGVIQANGEDLVHEAIPEAADSIIREVAASILGASTSPDAVVVPSRPAPTPSASPSKPGLSKSAPAGSCRATMPVVPEHHDFDEWCAAQSRTPPVAAHNQPAVARASSIPPMRPHKRQASSSDPSRAKHSRPSTSSSARIPSVPKAGMSSVNNSPAETARQSRREK
ncbi:hypothetical protein V6N13_110254 [Hibiscus sabdariffa]